MKSTRSNANADAYRDFDDFEINEELRLFQRAMLRGEYETAAILANNIDEWLSRGGELPRAWSRR